MATPPNNTPPNSRKIALESAKERRDQVISELESLDIQKRQAATEQEKRKIQKEINKLIKEEEGLRKRIALYSEKEEKIQKSIADSLADQISSLKVKEKLNQNISATDKLQLRATQIIQSQLERGVITYEQAEDAVKRLNRQIKDRRYIEDAILKSQQKQIELQQKIKKSQIDSAADYVKGMEQNIRKIPVLGDLMANTLMGPTAQRNLTAMFYKFFRTPGLKKRFETFGKGLSVVVSGALMAISEEEWWKKVQRAFATTNDQIVQYRDNIYRASVNSKLELATRENLVEATNELSGVYGKLALTDMNRLEDQVMLTKYLGLQGEEAAEIQRLGTIQGKDAEVVTQEIAAQVEGFNKLTGAGFVFNDIMKDVAKSSDEIKLIFNGSAKELASAIVTVKGLGLELTDVQQTADHLLDIESSISKQIQAQIVTGKQINLDKARELAFNNDLVGVAGELVKQGISYKELTEGNRIGNKLLADSLGMPLETLSKMVLEQEKFKELGVDISKGVMALTDTDRNRLEYLAAMGNETAMQTIEQMKQATVQEKLNKAMSDVKNIIAELAVILLPILHSIASVIGFLAKFKTLIYGIIGGFMTGGIGGAVIGGAAGLIADIANASSPMQPVQTPAPGISGAGSYYKETVSTNTVSVNTQETNNLLKQLITKVDQPVNVNIGDRAINKISNTMGLQRSFTPIVNR